MVPGVARVHFSNGMSIGSAVSAQFTIVTNRQTMLQRIGADSTGATGNFAPVLTQEPGQTLRFAPVPFMAVLLFFK